MAVIIDQPSRVVDAKIDEGTTIRAFTNIYGCQIGKECSIGTFVEIQNDVIIGDRVRVNSHSFLCSLVRVEDDVFIAHGVMTINDLFPPSRKRTGKTDEWKYTHIGKGSVIGSNATLLPVKIGEYSIVGAGAVVTKDVLPYSIVAGNPAKHVAYNTKAPGYQDYLRQQESLKDRYS